VPPFAPSLELELDREQAELGVELGRNWRQINSVTLKAECDSVIFANATHLKIDRWPHD
jgi:hypothetical protein